MPAVRRLKTQEDVRFALSSIYRQLEAETIDIPRAKAMIYCAQTISRVLSEHTLEERVKALEASTLRMAL
ncbi:MAG: hypothetical protein Q8O00_08665 [Holophaga sp.]|nr:hypothetical protein [Holophaga sp.]